ncbi:transmembrane and immunoglobulin domain-containing protein 2 [Mantella aurantiaca]
MVFWFYLALHLSFQHSVFGKLIVTQDPKELNSPTGDSVAMNCSWNITDARRIRVEWRKYQKLQTWDENGTLLLTGLWTSPDNMTTFTLLNQNRSSYRITKDTAVVTLESITEEDEGLYVCKVVIEIPELKSGQGNGTNLHVLNNTNGSRFPLWYLYFIILIIIPILITVYCCFHRWRRGRELHQDHTYGNMTRNTCKDVKNPATKIKSFTFGDLIVTQDPKELNLTTGDSVTMTCSWNITDARRIRVEWKKNQKLQTWDENGTLLLTGLWTSPDNLTTFTLLNQNRSSYRITKDTAVVTLESITEEDEGLYVCKVVFEIPELKYGQGNGTKLRVTNGSSPRHGLWAIICVFPVAILVGWFICRRKKRPKKRILQKTEQESMELHHLQEDDNNNDADGSGSSTNSVTWAISTVYESFDYFAIKNKDEKSTASSDKHATCSDDPAVYDQITACSDQITGSVKVTACYDQQTPCYDQITACPDQITGSVKVTACYDQHTTCYDQITACYNGADTCFDKPAACSDSKKEKCKNMD